MERLLSRLNGTSSVGEVGAPLVSEGAEEVVLRAGRDADLEHEQGDGDGEDAVAERFEPSGPQSPMWFADRLVCHGAMIVAGAAACADAALLNTCSPRRRHIPSSAPHRR